MLAAHACCYQELCSHRQIQEESASLWFSLSLRERENERGRKRETDREKDVDTGLLQRRALPGPRHGGIPTTVWTCLAVHVFQISTSPVAITEAARAGASVEADGGRGRVVAVGGGGEQTPIRNARDFFLRLFGYIANGSSHLYTHRYGEA